MKEVLERLYKEFYEPSPQVYLKAEIDTYHKELIQTLSKVDRKKVLRIIDVSSLIGLLRSKESFICGFKLAMDLS